ncbi:PREDICTED: uncharacterized protein LOC105962510 [Erythranthe guttata]|uniref:uncharacterized protein LOC105962510 n=1 Tax=Erythranthe guttata TaxID=4155 RepID=UPI00064DB842|nr:PREDICTED: uncharacterized protein LOC105962510 [Erythranthe guttata]|eukprot:XP_012842280.1 PREDICTED: uncharacterized protein LOC105962510 [Erythranthe guttata]
MARGRGKSLMSQVTGKGKSLMKALGRKSNNPDDPDRIGDRGVLASNCRRKATAREEAKRARGEATAVGVGPSNDLQVGHVRTQLQYASDDDEEMVANDDGDDDEEMVNNDDGNDDHDGREPTRKGGRGINFTIWDGPPYLEGPCEGGLENLEFMRWFKSHIAIYVWDGHERRASGRVESRNIALETYLGPQDDMLISRLEATGLYHLRHCWLPNMNQQLMLAFVERWQPETNSFHMPCGEMTITLHDVAVIMGLRVDGPLVAEVSQALECSQSLASLLGLGVMTTTDMF